MSAEREVRPADVLVVEDESLIAASLVRALEAHGHRACSVASVADAIARIDADPPDLVLLDLGLPDGDGTAVATHIARRHAAIPVLMLTARADDVDRLRGFESGAVDYLAKPFRLAELIARIEAQLRLRAAVVATTGDADRARYEAGDLLVDCAARTVSISGREIPLRPKEFDLLARLASSVGVVVTREQLIDDVWDANWWGSTKTLDVHINSIRRKLGERAGGASRVATIRGVGYRLDRKRPSR